MLNESLLIEKKEKLEKLVIEMEKKEKITGGVVENVCGRISNLVIE